MGYYDRAEGRWIGQKDGRVVKLLSITDGIAELDLDGSGEAASTDVLNELGVTDAERRELAALYQTGESLWRVPISHFSPYDYNWGMALPNGARYPNQSGPDSGAPGDDDCTESGSIIGCENQTLGEAVGIAGTPYSLRYQSDRVQGRAASNTFTISLTGDTVPLPLERIDLIIEIAGQRITRSYEPSPNLTYTYTWDRKDYFGRFVQGSHRITARIGYVYELLYVAPSGDTINPDGSVSPPPVMTPRSWDLPGGDEGYTQTAGREMTLWQVLRGSVASTVGLFDAHGLGLGGWTIDAQYSYDSVSRTVRGGDGSQWSARSLPTEMSTPRFKEWYCDDGGGGEVVNSVTSTALKLIGAGFSALGSNHSTVSANGTTSSPPGDNCVITSTSLYGTSAVNASPDGSIYVIGENVIRRIGSDGIAVPVAGTREAAVDPAEIGDGGQATEARLSNPTDTAVGLDGSLYIADTNNHRIRKVSPDGVISTIAGGPDNACAWDDEPEWYDGYPSVEAWLCHPSHLAVGRDGSIYFSSHSKYISRIGTDGGINLVAGAGSGATTGDGGSARQANTFGSVRDIAVGPEGGIYFVDGRGAVRRITPDGVVSSVTAPGCHGDCPVWDGESAPAINRPTNANSIAFDGQGGLIVGEYQRVLVVSPQGTIKVIATRDIHDFPTWLFGSVAASPSGTAYAVYSWGELSKIKRIDSPLPGYSAKNETIPSRDGQLLFAFDETGRHLQTSDALTGSTVVSFSYDPAGRLIGLTDGDGNTTQIERNAAGYPTAIVAPHGQRTSLQLDANGYISKITNPANESINLDTDADGLLRSITDPKGNSSHFTYNALGLLVKDENAAGGSKTLARTDNTAGFEVSSTTALGRTSRHQVKINDYWTSGRKVTNSDGTSTDLTVNWDGKRTINSSDGTALTATPGPDPRFGLQAPYVKTATLQTPSGRTLETTRSQTANVPDPSDPFSAQLSWQLNLGGTFTSTFDGVSDSFWSSSAEGRWSSTSVDFQRRPLYEQMSDLEAVSSVYDGQGRLTERTQGARTWRFSYDEAGNLAFVTNPLNQVESYNYDLAGRLTKQTMADGQEIDYAYDANGNLTSITPPGRQASTFAYDAVDQPLTLTQPDAGDGPAQTSYSWNPDGDLTGITRPDGSTIDYGYDSAGRLATISWPNGTTNYDYDAASGRVSSISGPSGTSIGFTYDGSLPLSETLSGPVAGRIDWDYDSLFRLSSTSVNGSSVSYEYDNDGLMTKAGELSLDLSPDTGFIGSLHLGDVSTSYEYTGYGERSKASTTFSSQSLLDLTYSYDDLGRISSKTDTTQTGVDDFAYRYDVSGSLVEVKRGGQVVESYTYDSNGNRTSATRSDGITLNATYDAQDRLKSFGSHTYGYSKNGDLTSATNSATGETASLQFDSLGNLKQVTTPDGEQIAYLTDPLDRRIGKKVDGQLVQGFLYGDDLGPEVELSPDGSVKSRFVYGTSAVTPDYMVKDGTTYRIVSDERGSPRLIVNAETGEIAQALDYDSYGRVVEDTSPGFQPCGFAGGLYDSDTGLTHFGARDYDAEVGRFISQDPLDFAGGDTNLYAYVWGDPVNLIDPVGLGGFSIHGITSGLSHFARSALNADVAAANVLTFGGVEATLTLTGGLSEIDTCSLSYKVGIGTGIVVGFLIPGGAIASVVKGERAVRTTGQLHHVISNPIAKALARHPTLAGKFAARDPRLVTRAVDESAHRGYQTWHRALDKEVVTWLERNKTATAGEFEQYLRGRYSQSDLARMFPNGF